MRRSRVGVTVFAAGCLLLLAWVTTAGEKPVFGGTDRAPTASAGPTRGDTAEDATHPPPPAQAGKERSPSSGLLILTYIMLSVVALGLIAILWRHRADNLARRVRREVSLDADAQPTGDAGLSELTRSLSSTSNARRWDLADGSPRNAIVRCWLSLEQAVSEAGFVRDPALTSAEFTTEVLGTYAVSTSAIQELAGLYREARFSAHEIGEDSRLLAANALRTLQSDLDSVADVHRAAAVGGEVT